MPGKSNFNNLFGKHLSEMSTSDTTEQPTIEKNESGLDVWSLRTPNGVLRYTAVQPLIEGLPNGYGFVSEPITPHLNNSTMFGHFSQHTMIDDIGQKRKMLALSGYIYSPWYYNHSNGNSEIKTSPHKSVFSIMAIHPSRILRTDQLIIQFPTDTTPYAQKTVKQIIPPYGALSSTKEAYLTINLDSKGDLDEMYCGERVFSSGHANLIRTGPAMYRIAIDGTQSCFIGTFLNDHYHYGELITKRNDGSYEYYAGGFSEDGFQEGIGTKYQVPAKQLGKPSWITGTWSKGLYEGPMKFVYADKTIEATCHNGAYIAIGTIKHKNGNLEFFQVIEGVEYIFSIVLLNNIQTTVAGVPVEVPYFVTELYKLKNNLFLNLVLEKLPTTRLNQTVAILYAEQNYWAYFWMWGKEIGPLPAADCSPWVYVEGTSTSALWHPFFNKVSKEFARYVGNDLAKTIDGLTKLFDDTLLINQFKYLAENEFPQVQFIPPKSNSSDPNQRAMLLYRKEIMKVVLPWVMTRVELIYQKRNQEEHQPTQFIISQLNALKLMFEQKRNPVIKTPTVLVEQAPSRKKTKNLKKEALNTASSANACTEVSPEQPTSTAVPPLEPLKHQRALIKGLVPELPECINTRFEFRNCLNKNQYTDGIKLLYRSYVLKALQRYKQPLHAEECALLDEANLLEASYSGPGLFQLPQWTISGMKEDARFYVLGLMHYLSGKEISVMHLNANFESELAEGYVANKMKHSDADLTKTHIESCFFRELINLFKEYDIPYQVDFQSQGKLAAAIDPRNKIQSQVLPSQKEREQFRMCVYAYASNVFAQSMQDRLQNVCDFDQRSQNAPTKRL